MGFILYAVFFALFPPLAFSNDKDRAYTGDRLARDVIIERYDLFKHDGMWRADVPVAYRTRWGTQIDKTCLDQLPSLKKTTHDLERWVDDAIQSVVNNCGVNYPQLDKYIKPWVTYLRRSVIICTSELKEKYGARAFHFMQDVPISSVQYFKRTKDPKQPLSSTYETTYLFTPAGFLNVSYLIHEVFHSTAANNEMKHNVSKVKDANEKLKIQRRDRIFILDKICSPALEKDILDSLLDQGMNSCITIFTKKTGKLRWWSDPLSGEDAKNLCKTFEDQRKCAKTDAPPAEINKILALYAKDIASYFPQWTGHFPIKARKFLGDINRMKLDQLLMKVRGNSCSETVFHENLQNGDLTFSPQLDGHFDFKQHGLSETLFLKHWNLDQINKKTLDHCKNEDIAQALTEIFGLFQKAYEKNYHTEFLMKNTLSKVAFKLKNEAELFTHSQRIQSMSEDQTLHSFLKPETIVELNKLPGLLEKWKKKKDHRQCRKFTNTDH